MSDGNLQEYFPESDLVGMWPFRSCLVCGANVSTNHLYLHANWHDRQKSTERLILDNQPARVDPIVGYVEVTPHGV